MIMGMPLVMWLGLLGLILLGITLILGLKVQKGRYELLVYHMLFAKFLIAIAVVHLIFALLFYFFGVTI